MARYYGERFKLSAPEWRTMAVLGQQGAMSANAVIAQTTMDKVRVSRAVAKLLKAGLITREADPQDRRRAIINLTMAGQDIYREIVPLVQEVEFEIVAELTAPSVPCSTTLSPRSRPISSREASAATMPRMTIPTTNSRLGFFLIVRRRRGISAPLAFLSPAV